jgi:RNA polymerase sigma-70 factor (ECF subfamily)
VVAAGGSDPNRAAAALEQLCRKYWYPIYAFIRRRGSNREHAEDLTQAFFAYLLEKEALKRVDQQKGRFRSFLLASLTNFLANEWDKQRTLKRGGQHQIVSLDEAQAEEIYSREPIDALTPERLFERRWAFILLSQVLARLEQEHASGDRTQLFMRLRPALTEEMNAGWHAKCAGELGMTEGAIRVALHRLRRRFGELLRSEIAQTVAQPEDVDDEIRHLFAAFSV